MTLATLRAAALVAALTLGASPALAQSITVTPTSVDFGDVSVPGGTDLTVEVQNDGGAQLVISDAFMTDLTGDGAFFDGGGVSDEGDFDRDFPFLLAPGESVTLRTTVSPRVGRQNGTMTIESNDPDEATVVVPVTFFGTEITFGPTPDSLDFGQVTVTVDAFDDVVSPPTVCRPVSFTTAGDEGGFARQFGFDGASVFSAPDGDLSFSAGETVAFDVCYTPEALGEASANLTFEIGSSVNGFLFSEREITLVAEAVLNQAPVPQGIADGDVVEVMVDTPKTIRFAFASPEAGQTTTITASEPAEFSAFLITTPGNPATAEIELSAFNGTGGFPVGDYGLTVEGCDDAPNGEDKCTTLGITVRVSYPPTKSCDVGVAFYVNDFRAQPSDNYVQFYSTESGLVDLTGCSFVAFDAVSEEVVVSFPLTLTLSPFGEPQVATGGLPAGPGAIAVVKGTPAVGDDVSSVLGEVVNAIVYRTDDDVFGVCGAGSPFAFGGPAAPCNTAAGRAALAEALARIGGSVAAEDAADLDLTVRTAPNPVAGAGAVSFGLAAAGTARVALFDALGRQVATLADGPYGVGRHEVGLDAGALPAGVYAVRVVAGGEVRTARLTVVR